MALIGRLDMFRVTSLLVTLAIYNQMFSDVSSKPEEVKGENLRKIRVMYDLSKIHVKEISNGNNTLSDLYSDGDAAATFYYALNENVSSKIQSNIGGGDSALHGISFMYVELFGNNASAYILLDLSNESYFTGTSANLSNLRNSPLKSVVMSAQLRSCGSCYVAQKKIKEYFQATIKQYMESDMGGRHNVQSGFEYNQKFIECCDISMGYETLTMADNAILNVEVSPLTTKLSYGGFSEMMTKMIKQNRQFVRNYNSHCTMYVRFIITNWNDVIGTDKTTYDRYEALIAKYFVAWKNSSTDYDIHFILPPFPKAVISDNNQFLKEKVARSLVLTPKERLVKQNNDSNILQRIACETQDEIKQLLKIYNNIVFYQPPLAVLNLVSTPCQIGKTSLKYLSEISMNTSNIFLDFRYSRNRKLKYEDVIVLLNLYDQYAANTSQLFNFSSIYLDSITMSHLTSKHLVEASRLKNKRLNCYFDEMDSTLLKGNLSALVEETVKECSPMLKVSQDIVWDSDSEIDDTEELLEFLNNFHKAKQMVESRYPNKHLILKISGGSRDFEEGDSVHCNYHAKQIREYYQTSLSFANIHQWTRLIVSPSVSGIETFTRRSITGFRLYWRTNAEKSIAGDSPMTFPCIQWTQAANQSGIDFLRNHLLGSTFHVKLRQGSPVTAQELEKALRFVFGRFLFVELVADDVHEFNISNNALSQAFLHDMKATRYQASHNIVPLLYIEIPLTHLLQLPKKVSNASLVAVHVTGWENSTFQNVNQEIPFSRR